MKKNTKIIQNHKRSIKKANMRKILNRKNNRQKKLLKKVFDKVEKFHQQLRQGHYYIFTVFHRCLYQHSVRLFHDQKYNILTSELHHPVTSFKDKINVCETSHTYL